MGSIQGGYVKNAGNASLIEIAIAALILVGSTALVSTMAPDVRALEPTTSEQGYLDSVMDAFVLSGEDPATVVADAWAGTPSVWFDEVLDSYSLYLVTGHDRILIQGTERNGSSAQAFFVMQATIANQIPIFEVNGIFEPGQSIYSNQGLGYVVPNLGSGESVSSINHKTPLGTNSIFADAPGGEEWVDVWNAALDNRTIPSEIPYGVWEATVQTWIIQDVLPGPDRFERWYVLRDPTADTDKAHFAVYALEVAT